MRSTVNHALSILLIALLTGCGSKDETPAPDTVPGTPSPTADRSAPDSAPGAAGPAAANRAEPPGPGAVPEPEDEFARRFREILEMEAQAEFPPAYTAARKMRTDFASHPRVAELNELILRLKQERESATELSFAIKALTSSDPRQRTIARQKLIDAGRTGLIHLRLALKSGQDDTVKEAAAILTEQKDPESLPLLLEQFEKYPGTPLARAMARGFVILNPGMTTEQLSGLLQLIRNDTGCMETGLIEVFMDVLRRSCNWDATAFNDRVGHPEAFDILVNWTRRAVATARPESVEFVATSCAYLLPNEEMIRVEYFSDANYKTVLAMTSEHEIAQPQNRQFPTPDKRQDNFSARWSGFLSIDEKKDYTFYFNADDKGWLTVDGKGLLYSEWGREQKKEISLDNGLHPIEVRYQQTTGNARCKLEWSAPGIPRTTALPYRAKPGTDFLLAAAKAPDELLSDDIQVSHAASKRLAESGATGRWILRDAARAKSIDQSVTLIERLAEWNDSAAVELLVTRLPETKPDTEIRTRMVAALRNMGAAITKEQCAALFAEMKKDTAFTMPPATCALAGVLEYGCLGDENTFNERIGDPTACATLKEHVSGALASSDWSAVIRACANGGFLAPRVPGIRAAYYSGPDMNNMALSRIESEINVERDKFPHPDKTMQDVSARWTAWFHVSQPGNYRFFAFQRQNVNGWVDGKHVLSAGGRDAHGNPTTLAKGWHQLRIDYRQGAGENFISVDWEGPGMSRRRFTAEWARTSMTEPELNMMPSHIARLAGRKAAPDSAAPINWPDSIERVFLRNAVRHSSGGNVVGPARMLTILHDAETPGLIVDRLKKGTSPELQKIFLAFLRDLPQHLSDEDCRWLYAEAKGKPLEENRDRLTVLFSMLENKCFANKAAFNTLMANDQACDSLGDVIKNDLEAGDDAAWRWACEFGGPFAPFMKGVRGRHYEGQSFDKLLADQLDSGFSIEDKQFPHPRNLRENVSSRFRTHLWVENPGKYRFVTRADDGSRVYVDGNLIINAWTGATGQERWGAAELEKGWHLVEADFRQASGSGSFVVQWEGPKVRRQTIDLGSAMVHPWSREINHMLALIKQLGDADKNKVNQARDMFTKQFDAAGRACLQRALPVEKGEVLKQVALLLVEAGDKSTVAKLVERLKESADHELAWAAAPALSKVADTLTTKQLVTLLGLVRRDTTFARRTLLDVFAAVYEKVRRNPRQFDKRLDTEGAFGVLQEYVWRASQSSDPTIAAWGKDKSAGEPWKKK